MIKISVIVPIYNVEKYLKAALLSLKNQTYKNFEVIMVNDASTDNSLEIAKSFLKDERFKLEDCRINGGLSVARNIGMKRAKGKYVYFFDSDDLLPSNLFSILINNFNNVDLISFNSTNINLNSGSQISIRNIISNKIFNREAAIHILLNKRMEPAPWSYIFKKSLLRNHIVFPEGKNFEDITFTPQIISNISYMRLIKFNPAGYYYRANRSGSITNATNVQGFLKQFNDKRELYDRKLSFLLEHYSNSTDIYEWYVNELSFMYVDYHDTLYKVDQGLFDKLSNNIKNYSRFVQKNSFTRREKLFYLMATNNKLSKFLFKIRSLKRKLKI